MMLGKSLHFEHQGDSLMKYRATCEELLKEYKACESADYISYVRLSHSHSILS